MYPRVARAVTFSRMRGIVGSERRKFSNQNKCNKCSVRSPLGLGSGLSLELRACLGSGLGLGIGLGGEVMREDVIGKGVNDGALTGV